MTILAKLTREKKDLEKVPLPLHLNDEAMMHHGSLMSVSLTKIVFHLHLICAIKLVLASTISCVLRALVALQVSFSFAFCICVGAFMYVGEPQSV